MTCHCGKIYPQSIPGIYRKDDSQYSIDLHLANTSDILTNEKLKEILNEK